MRAALIGLVFSVVVMAGIAQLDAADTPASGENAAGQVAFTENKCQTCHAVSSAGIEAKAKSAKILGPDLKGVAADYEEGWFAEYIKGAADLDGKKHRAKFKGTDDDLKAILAWLKTQQ